ncbi:MAG TPA: response regulator, partial [Steroidobacteraceae bacterium]|nr:response regulator [Steroidobacteraceae bacterium]
MRILLIEDDHETAHYISVGLSGDGHEIAIAGNGREGLNRANSEKWDLLIVDRMLPELDGLSIVKELRHMGAVIPVLFLTTLGGVDDRVTGLNAGADDYLVKPFSFSELLARVAALG